MLLKHLRFKLTFLFLDVIILRHNTMLCNLHHSTLLLSGMRLSCCFSLQDKENTFQVTKILFATESLEADVGHVLPLSCFFFFFLPIVMLSDIMSYLAADLYLQGGLEAKVCGADLVKFMSQRR